MSIDIPKYPSWTPKQLIESIEDCRENLLNRNDHESTFYAATQRNYGILIRLATRPEMERVWEAIINGDGIFPWHSDPNYFSHPNGILGRLAQAISDFDNTPLLTAKEFDDELVEIEDLSRKLARKLQKFNSKYPFTPSSMFTDSEQEDISTMMKTELITPKREYERKKWLVEAVLNHCLPPLNIQLETFANIVKKEAINKWSRPAAFPRKIRDKNAFRTYFIGKMHNFFTNFSTYSATRVATFCSVALDDPEITEDLVRKLYPLDQKTKEYFKGLKNLQD